MSELSDPYQMTSNSESDMDLIILVEREKKNTNNFVIGNFTILTQLCDVMLCFEFFFNTNNFVIGNFTISTQLCDFFVVF